jgi:hypothetical protein
LTANELTSPWAAESHVKALVSLAAASLLPSLPGRMYAAQMLPGVAAFEKWRCASTPHQKNARYEQVYLPQVLSVIGD